MAKFRQYLPAYIDHKEEDLIEFNFNTIEELKEKLVGLFMIPEGYELCCGDSETLMIVTTSDNLDYTFWVIGFVEGLDLTSVLKNYEDAYYKDSRNPEIELTGDEKVDEIISCGKDFYKRLRVMPPKMEKVPIVYESNIAGVLNSANYGESVLYNSFCTAYQHFHFIGDRKDIYYFVGLENKVLEFVKDNIDKFVDKSDFIRGWHCGGYRLSVDIGTEQLVGQDNLSKFYKKAERYYSTYKKNILKLVREKYPDKKNIAVGEGNFHQYFVESLVKILVFEYVLGVHKTLPEIIKKEL